MSLTTTHRLNRRELLKLSLGASLALTTIGTAATLTGCSSSQPAASMLVLRESDLPILGALYPALIGPHPALDAVNLQTAVKALDSSLAHSSPAIQKDVLELFDLLGLPLTRGPMTGIWGAWQNTSAAQVEAFLLRWRDSRLDMLRKGHKALSQLLLMSWYGSEHAWAAIGYPGPPRI